MVVGKRTITFRKVTPKNVAALGAISGLVIQAMRAIGKDSVKEDEIARILDILKKEKLSHLQHDLRLAPEWIRQIMQAALNPFGK